jgi:hypothetical protein
VGLGIVASAALLRVLSLYWSRADVCTVQSSSEAHRESVYGRRRKGGRHGLGGNVLFRLAATSRAHCLANVTTHQTSFQRDARLSSLTIRIRGAAPCPSLLLSYTCCILVSSRQISGSLILPILLSCRALYSYSQDLSSHQRPGLLHSPHQVNSPAQIHNFNSRLHHSALPRYAEVTAPP